MYGGTPPSRQYQPNPTGLSPRVRGNPPNPKCSRSTRWVYPRVYGGTLLRHVNIQSVWGLSPRVRGNLRAPGSRIPCDGSIPACTGEPSRGESRDRASRVYPRVYGGTPPSGRSMKANAGLSPRVRGNPARLSVYPCMRRSIPACTGEPSSLGAFAFLAQVYPRVYGGTSMKSPLRSLAIGLSPRVRGNLHERGLNGLNNRSIPACTGEPMYRCYLQSLVQVYPRVYGGTDPALGLLWS